MIIELYEKSARRLYEENEIPVLVELWYWMSKKIKCMLMMLWLMQKVHTKTNRPRLNVCFELNFYCFHRQGKSTLMPLLLGADHVFWLEVGVILGMQQIIRINMEMPLNMMVGVLEELQFHIMIIFILFLLWTHLTSIFILTWCNQDIKMILLYKNSCKILYDTYMSFKFCTFIKLNHFNCLEYGMDIWVAFVMPLPQM